MNEVQLQVHQKNIYKPLQIVQKTDELQVKLQNNNPLGQRHIFMHKDVKIPSSTTQFTDKQIQINAKQDIHKITSQSTVSSALKKSQRQGIKEYSQTPIINLKTQYSARSCNISQSDNDKMENKIQSCHLLSTSNLSSLSQIGQQNHLQQTSTKLWLKKRYASKVKQNYIMNKQQIQHAEEIEQLFKVYDKDNKGQIEASQLVKMLQENGIAIQEQEIKEIFNLVDENQNGRLSLDEFKKFIESHEAQQKFREVALQIRQRIDEDYKMYRIAERKFLPLSFNKMLSYLYHKSKYRDTLNDMQKQRDIATSQNVKKDLDTFLELFSNKDELLNDYSPLQQQMSATATNFQSFFATNSRAEERSDRLRTVKPMRSDKNVVGDMKFIQSALDHKQHTFRSTNVSQLNEGPIFEIDNRDQEIFESFDRNTFLENNKYKKYRKISVDNFGNNQMNLFQTPTIQIEQLEDQKISQSKDSRQSHPLSMHKKQSSDFLSNMAIIKTIKHADLREKFQQISPIRQFQKSELTTQREAHKPLLNVQQTPIQKMKFETFKWLPSMKERNLHDKDHLSDLHNSTSKLMKGFRKQLKYSNFKSGMSHHALYCGQVKLSEDLIPRRREVFIRKGDFQVQVQPSKIKSSRQFQQQQPQQIFKQENMPLNTQKINNEIFPILNQRSQSQVYLNKLQNYDLLKD
eukprot:403350614